MSRNVEDLKRTYAAQIHSYINDNRHLFGHGVESKPDTQEKSGLSPRLAQEMLIMPGRPWWLFLRPKPVEPPSTGPKPPGWSPEWQWRYPEGTKPAEPRWFDPKGGEFRWHAPDRRHRDGHWDYNPWRHWNDEWRNVMPPREGPFGVPPIVPQQAGRWIWA